MPWEQDTLIYFTASPAVAITVLTEHPSLFLVIYVASL